MALELTLPATSDGKVYAGDTIPIDISLTEGSNPLVLTGMDITATFKINPDDADNDFDTIQKTLDNGIEVIDENNGQLVIILQPEDTTHLRKDTTYFLDVQFNDAGDIFTGAHGTILISADITQAAA